MRKGHKILAETSEWKKPLRRHKRRRDDNIKTDLEGENVDWIHLAQNRNPVIKSSSFSEVLVSNLSAGS
jgi:hypothetical protein